MGEIYHIFEVLWIPVEMHGCVLIAIFEGRWTLSCCSSSDKYQFKVPEKFQEYCICFGLMINGFVEKYVSLQKGNWRNQGLS